MKSLYQFIKFFSWPNAVLQIRCRSEQQSPYISQVGSQKQMLLSPLQPLLQHPVCPAATQEPGTPLPLAWAAELHNTAGVQLSCNLSQLNHGSWTFRLCNPPCTGNVEPNPLCIMHGHYLARWIKRKSSFHKKAYGSAHWVQCNNFEPASCLYYMR